MVEFTNEHKEDIRITSNYQDTTIQWYRDDESFGDVDIRDIETGELWALRNSVQRFMQEQLATIDAELNNWTTIYCSVCGQDDLAHRGFPFITWGIRAGYILCPRHVRAFDLKGTPEGDQLDALKAEQREIAELFG